MKGDFSQLDPERDARYTAVLHQQGRLWLDSDWNADAFERIMRLARETVDVVGASGFPAIGEAFKISAPPKGADQSAFLIGSGRGYVDGIMCELGAESATYLNQPDLPNPPAIPMPSDGQTLYAVIYLEAWYRLITFLQDPSIREVALGGPDTAVRLQTIAQVRVAPVGSTAVSCADAPNHLPKPSAGTLTTGVPPPSPPPDQCTLPNPEGYTGQANRLYRVEIHTGGDVAGWQQSTAFRAQLLADAPAQTTTLNVQPALTAAQQGALNASKSAAITDTSGRYAALQVASVSAGGTTITLSAGLPEAFPKDAVVSGGAAQFKWSRNNASDAVGITPSVADPTLVTLASLGRDTDTALRAGDLVEISDDASDLGPAAGFLTYLAADPDPDTLVARLADPLPPEFQHAEQEMHPVLRRWDGRGFAAAAFDPVQTPDMSLEDGIFISFGGTNGASNLRAGDYWTFTARSIDASVEILTNAPPAGIVRHIVPLGTASWTNSGGTIAFKPGYDCRPQFNALADLPGGGTVIKVTDVEAVGAGGDAAPCGNDEAYTPTELAGGLQFVLSGPPDTKSITSSTCSAAIALAQPPIFNTPLTVSVETNLGGTWGVGSGNAIVWKAASDLGVALTTLRALAQGAPNARLRFRLRGGLIWEAGDPSTYLDGDAFGEARADGTIALRLPSGDGIAGGDFETWIWLTSDPQQQLSVYAAIGGLGESAPRVDALPATGVGTARTLKSNSITSTVRGVTLDANDRIYVGNLLASSGASVFVYPAQAQADPVYATLTGLTDPRGMAIDGSGNVYVVDRNYTVGGTGQPAVAVYAPVQSGGSFAPKSALTDATVTLPSSVATDANGNVYVTNQKYNGMPDAVTVFGPSGSVVRSIFGTSTGMSTPFGVAVDQKYIYVANQGAALPNQTVTVYDLGADGNAKPVRTIAGAQLSAAAIYSCAVDASSYLYVACGKQVLVYPPNANGNQPPVLTLSDPTPPVNDIIYIAVGK